jgi:glycosyltransferase involved in cell wall biosynthesis
MRKPTLLMMNRVYPPVRGASGRVLRDLARGFARDGWQVTVITTGPKAIKERDGAVRVIRVKAPEKPPGAIGYFIIWIKMLWAALSLPAVELVVTMTDPPLFALAGDILKAVKKSKHVHWVQDVYPDLFPVIGVRFPKVLLDGMQWLSIGAMRRADKVVVIGRCIARRLGFAGLSPKKMAVIPNWPDIELGHHDVDDADAFSVEDMEQAIAGVGRAENYRVRDEQVKTGAKFRVLYAGNIGKIHPVQVVLDAARILQNSHPEIEFLFVGDGPKYDEITRAKAQEHLDNVKLLPYQPPARLSALMESGDVHLITMDDRAAGLAVPSKMYSGLAAHRPCIYIGPSASEASKVIKDYKIGRVIPQGKAQELADAILEYRMDGDVWFAAHENAKKAARVFVPSASIGAFIERAWGIVGGRPPAEAFDAASEVREAAE